MVLVSEFLLLACEAKQIGTYHGLGRPHGGGTPVEYAVMLPAARVSVSCSCVCDGPGRTLKKAVQNHPEATSKAVLELREYQDG